MTDKFTNYKKLLNIILLGMNIIEKTYNKYENHDYHVINIKDVEWGSLQGANYHNTLFNPETKETTFA